MKRGELRPISLMSILTFFVVLFLCIMYRYTTLRGFSGIFKHVPAVELGLNQLSDGKNVACRDGKVEKMTSYGSHALIQSAGYVSMIHAFENDGLSGEVDIVCIAGTSGVTNSKAFFFADGGTIVNNIHGAAAVFSGNYNTHAVAFRGDLIICDAGTKIRKWAYPSTIADLGGLSAVDYAYCLGTCSPERVVLGHTVESGTHYPTRIRFSAVANYEDWTTANDAGTVDLREESDTIIALIKSHRDSIIYRSNSVWSMRFVGGNNVFDFRPLFRGISLWNHSGGVYSRTSPKCVAVVGQRHYFLSMDDFYMLASADSEPISIGKPIRSYFLSDISGNSTYKSNVFTTVDYGKKEIYWWYPSTAVFDVLCDKAVVFNYETFEWSIFDGSGTKKFYTGGVFERKLPSYEDAGANKYNLLLGCDDGRVYNLIKESENNGNYTGEAVTAIFPLNVLEDGSIAKARIDGVRFVTDGNQSYDLDFNIGVSEEYTHGQVFSKTYDTYPLESTWEGWKRVNKVGKYFQIKWRTTGANQPFRVTQVQVRWTPLGVR